MRNHFTLLLAFSAGCSLSAQHLLPTPQQITWGKGKFDLLKEYVIKNESDLTSQHQLLLSPFGNNEKDSCSTTTSRRLILQPLSGMKSEEAYHIKITPDTLCVAAASSAGFFYAQRTLLQLLRRQALPCCEISDAPAYPWRGAMIDVSRHFFPIEVLKKQIDILSSYKINRLHLHLTDAAGWRMEIKRYPRLTQNAAWRTDSLWKDWWNGERKYTTPDTPGAYGGYYTQTQLKELVEYARQRYIMIIPEIEMPAHSEEVLTVYPELSCTHEPYKQADFCPGNIATYDFLENVLKEVLAVFPSPYIHIGGDEAGKSSWKNCPLCQQKMKEEGISDLAGLQTYLILQIGEFLNHHGRHLIGWDEIIDEKLPKGSQVMVWRNINYAHTAINHGYEVILSPASYCYLDSYQDAPHTQPEAIGGLIRLEKLYDFRPEENFSPTELPYIKGIQGNLWTEYVPTPSHLEYMLYPRMLAIAEIGWNGTKEKNYPHFKKVILQATESLQKNGVNTFDLRHEVGDRKESLTPVPHIGCEANIQYNLPVSPYYKGNHKKALLDGLYGGWNHSDGRWQGFIGKNYLDVTIDLKERKKIKRISTDFLQSTKAEIFFPTSYIILASDDGKKFKKLFEKNSPSTPHPSFDIDEWTWKGNVKVRFLRILAKPGDFGGWIFTDEIKIE